MYSPNLLAFFSLDVYGLLQKERIQGVPFHSQMNQKKRETQLNLFRSGKCPILLSTDVVARGIHIKNVEYIINYDFPESIEQVCLNASVKMYDYIVVCFISYR